MSPRHRLKNPFTMSKNGGKSAKSTPESAETFVFISGNILVDHHPEGGNGGA